MKHKIFALVAVAMVAVAGVNAYFAYDSELSSFVDLQEGDVEAVAEGESFLEWWNSKIYACELEVIWAYAPMRGYYQKYEKQCVPGSALAHCWECR